MGNGGVGRWRRLPAAATMPSGWRQTAWGLRHVHAMQWAARGARGPLHRIHQNTPETSHPNNIFKQHQRFPANPNYHESWPSVTIRELDCDNFVNWAEGAGAVRLVRHVQEEAAELGVPNPGRGPQELTGEMGQHSYPACNWAGARSAPAPLHAYARKGNPLRE